MFAFMISGLVANFDSRNFSVLSGGRLYSQDSRPSANMFLARSASFRETSYSSSALTVIEVIGTACTL